MKLSVHVLNPVDAAAQAHLYSNLHSDIHLTFGPDNPTPANYHILVAGRPKREHLSASPNLHTLVIPWSGLPDTTRELLLDFPHIAVHNLHYNAVPVAEMVVTLMLSAIKFVIPMDRTLRSHDWRPRYQPNPSALLAGKTALILGYGAVGQRVARACRGLGMKVVAIRRNVSTSSQNTLGQIHPPSALNRLLPQANALLICLPHTPETDGLIGEKELALLPSDTVLVNVGRGPIVDEAALYAALRDGALHAAGLDVWYNYPANEAARSHTPPSTFPFHQLENVVMSPHRAGHSRETQEQRMMHLAALLNTAAKGEPMPNQVDVQVGY